MKPLPQFGAPPIGPPRQSANTTNAGRFSFSVPSPYAIQEPMLGWPGSTKPVFIWNSAGAWSLEIAYIDRISASLSACRATCGNNSEISIPHSPCWRNLQGEAINAPGFPCATITSPFPVSASPWRFASSGLGSKVST